MQKFFILLRNFDRNDYHEFDSLKEVNGMYNLNLKTEDLPFYVNTREIHMVIDYYESN